MRAIINKTLKISLLSIIIFCGLNNSNAQDASYSQYFNNPLYYNPAYTGLNLGMNIRMNARKMWTNIAGENYNANFSLDIADRNIPGAGGLGLIVNQSSEGMGLIKTFNAGILPAVRIPLSENAIIQVGALISVVSKQINWSDDMIFPDQIDARWGYIGLSEFQAPSNDHVIFPDFSFGTVLQFKGGSVDGTLGVAAHHLMEPNQAFYQTEASLYRKFVGHFDLIIDVTNYGKRYGNRMEFKLNPGIMYQRQSSLQCFNVGLNIYMSHLYIGAWLRNDFIENRNYADLILLAGLDISFSESSRMKIVYTYDMTATTINYFWGPSHEISLILEFKNIKFFSSESNGNIRASNKKYPPLECSNF